jgi:EAL domain-containing protein (putative c-di-GMP-specific phosphodiesterase class I)
VIVGSLVRLARLRDIECIAEWVEDAETMERLRVLACATRRASSCTVGLR